MQEQRFFWAEQYLLQAFLAYNEQWEVLLAANALARTSPDAIARVIPSFDPRSDPDDLPIGAFWIRKRASAPR